VAEQFEQQYGEDPLMDLASYQDLYSRAVIAKIELSSRDATTIVYSYNGNSIRLKLTREEFEARARHLIERCKMISEIVIAEAQVTPNELDCIVLVGGMTRMPAVLSMLAEVAPGVRLAEFANPDEVVARGAAIQASLLQLRNEDNAKDQDASAKVPDAVRRQFSRSDGEIIRVSNITTHTLGVVLWDEAQGQTIVSPMIKRGAALPASTQRSFAVSKDGMASLSVRVVEGESTVPEDCTPLGTCEAVLPFPVPKGTPVSLTYGYTDDQVLEVLVEAAGVESRVSISRASDLTDEELARVTEDIMMIEVT